MLFARAWTLGAGSLDRPLVDAITHHHRHAGIYQAPIRRRITLAEGQVFALGAGGDLDPGFAFSRLLIAVDSGTKPVAYGSGLVAAVGGSAERGLIPAGSERRLEALMDSLVLYNVQGSAGPTTFDLEGVLEDRRNVGARGHPGHGEFLFRIPFAPNGIASITRELPHPITITGVSTWSKTLRTSAGGSYLLTVSAAGQNVLAAASVNLETLLPTSLQSHGLTATSAHLSPERGQPLVVAATSNNIDLSAGGDLFVSVAYIVRA